MIDFKELMKIRKYIELYGGYREKNVINNLISIELGQNDKDHKVYTFYGNNREIGFQFDIKTYRVVG